MLSIGQWLYPFFPPHTSFPNLWDFDLINLSAFKTTPTGHLVDSTNHQILNWTPDLPGQSCSYKNIYHLIWHIFILPVYRPTNFMSSFFSLFLYTLCHLLGISTGSIFKIPHVKCNNSSSSLLLSIFWVLILTCMEYWNSLLIILSV